MPYGINSGPEVFQWTMEQIYAGYSCEIIVDDYLIWVANTQEQGEKLKRVLDRPQKVNLKINERKCSFRVGHVLSSKGVQADPNNAEAIQKLPTLADKRVLQRFLGMISSHICG